MGFYLAIFVAIIVFLTCICLAGIAFLLFNELRKEIKEYDRYYRRD